MAKKIIITACLLSSIVAFKAVGQITPPSAAPEISNFSLNPDNVGAASHSVNLFTGDLALPFNLVSLPGKEGLDINVSISYNSNVQNQVDTWNLDAPTGILGLGWSMDMPKIVCDHKGTGTREDDTYYLVEGGSSNKLIRIGSGSDATGSYNTYQTKNYQFWQIKFYFDPADYALGGSGPNKWVIVRENGFKYVYGDKNSGRSTMQYTVRWNNWIGNSSNTTGQSQMASIWNLSEINNLWGEKVTFEYTNVDQFVGSASGQKQTEASYLKQIVDPIGRKVQFFYNNKSAQFYMEPHTEQAEPDAYQEMYEKQYLDHIDVLQETGSKYLSVNLRYTTINAGTNTAKMLLSYIEKRNGSNQALPGVHFDYFTSTGSTGYKGFLQKVTYPTGGSVSYTYAMSGNTLGHSSRNLNIPAPGAGYAEPNMWFGSDYVVVTWRALGGGGTHITGSSTTLLYVYQWVGEWKGQFLMTLNTSASFSVGGNTTDASHYLNFQVVVEDNFFAILSNSGGGNVYQPYLFYKDESARANWLNYVVSAIDLGSGTPSLVSGDNFVVIHSMSNNSTYTNTTYTYQGSGFTTSTISGVSGVVAGFSYLTAANNYFLKHFQDISPGHPVGPQMTFFYLNEEKKWLSSTIPSGLTFSGQNGSFYSPSNFYGANSFITAMAGQNPEYIYRWDMNYLSFYRDNVLGTWNDFSYVFNIDNSMVGLVDYQVRGVAARFDGNSWMVSALHSTDQTHKVSFGSDLLVTTELGNTLGHHKSSFDPNARVWSLQTSSIGGGYVRTYGDFYSVGSDYFKMPSGTWNNIGSVNSFLVGNCLLADNTYYIKNGTLVSGIDPIGPLGAIRGSGSSSYYTDYDQFNNYIIRTLVGNNTAANFNSSTGSYKDALSLDIYRNLTERIKGQQVDYPVGAITISGTGSADQNVAFEYNFSTATIDPSGTVAQYGDVNVIQGSNVVSSKPNGYSKTHFYNGLSSNDDQSIPVSFSNMNMRLLGQPYDVTMYDVNSNVVSFTTTTNTVYPVVATNSVSTQVDVSYYTRPTQTNKTQDNINVLTFYSYDANSGQLRSSTMYTAANMQSPIVQENIYWYEKYDASKTLNILTPVAQVSKKVNGVYTEANVTRYKNWTAQNLGGTAPAAFDQLVWKGTNNSQFAFWDPATYPSNTLADWTMVQQISVRDNYSGTPLETLAKGNISSAVILDVYKIRPVAKIANANYNQTAFANFEASSSQGNWSWADGTLITGSAKTGSNYLNVGTTGISNSQLISSENYVLSFWALSSSGTLAITGVGTVTVSSPSTWTYYEYPITGVTSFNLKLTGATTVSIDDLRLFPKRASMSTSTYDLVYGPTSQTDNNNRVVYTQYDAWGRTQNILDENQNIIKSYTYNVKK